MVDGFLGRWSQRKQAVRAGQAQDEPVVIKQVAQPPVAATEEPQAEPVAQVPPAPSLEDVKSLTTQSDFKPFVARDVPPEVRNAAMKKLFTDPHFNLMDGLDTYVDDYSKPDPLPDSMLRQMASAKFLKLFEDENKDPSEQPQNSVRDDANTAADESVSQSAQSPPTDAHPLTDNQPQARGTDDDHSDLRLQPNHAAGPQEPGRGAE